MANKISGAPLSFFEAWDCFNEGEHLPIETLDQLYEFASRPFEDKAYVAFLSREALEHTISDATRASNPAKFEPVTKFEVVKTGNIGNIGPIILYTDAYFRRKELNVMRLADRDVLVYEIKRTQDFPVVP